VIQSQKKLNLEFIDQDQLKTQGA